MDFRSLKFALVLSETLHFGQAAEQVFISQPAFSQQIARLEREMGARLFERSASGVALTRAGQAFVPKARQLLEELASTHDEVRRIAAGSAGLLSVGIFAEGLGELTPIVIGRFREELPQVDLRFVELTMSDQFDRLRDGIVDVAFLRPPLTDDSIAMAPLFAEPRAVALPAKHRLAGAADVSVEDLVGEAFATAAAPQAWSSWWSCDDVRGEPVRALIDVHSVGECLAAIAYLDAVDTWPLSATRIYSHPGVRCVPIRDGGYTSIAVAWRREDERPLVRRFRTIAEHVAHEHYSVVEGAVHPDEAPPGTPLPATP